MRWATIVLSALIPVAFCLNFALQPYGLQDARSVPTGPKKRALLIGISKYDRGNENTDWWDLSSGRDVDELQKVLADKQRFGFDEVKVLKTSAETTHKFIVDTFRDWLIKSTSPGDIVFIHYSGHGSQAPDTDTPDNPIVGDEFSGLDSTLVLSDYVSMQDPSHDIRDDEIGILLQELNKKKPGQVFLSFDTCHAGHITRGGGRFIARGRSWTGPKPTPSTAGIKHQKTAGGFLTQDVARGHGYVVLEASRDDQLAHQFADEGGSQIGLLTYALIRALNNAGPNTTYRDIFNRVNETVASQGADQDPQIEGDDIDNIFLTKIRGTSQPYIPIHVTGNSEMILKEGRLHGVTQDSLFGLYPAGAVDLKASPPIATARVSSVDLTESTLQLTEESRSRGVKEANFQAGKAVERLHNYGDNRLRVDAHLIAGLPHASALVEGLKALPLVNLDTFPAGQWDIRLCPSPCPTLASSVTREEQRSANSPAVTLTVQRADGSMLEELPNDDQIIAELKPRLERESRWRFVSSLSNRDSSSRMSIDLRIVPVDVETTAPCKEVKRVIGDRQVTQTHGRLAFAECDYVMLELRNSGSGEAYVSVLDLQNNGAIAPLWPIPRHNVQENHVPDDNQWHRIPFPYVIRITKPLGREMFKVIATSEPTDFSPIVDPQLSRGARNQKEANAMKSPLGQLLRSATVGRRGEVAGVDPGDWTTTSLIFDVVETPLTSPVKTISIH